MDRQTLLRHRVRKSYRGDVQPLPTSLIATVTTFLAIWVAFNVLLYGSIFYGSFTVNWGVDYTLTFDNFIKLFGQGMSDGAWPSLLDTLLYAGIAAPITAILGLLIAYIVVRQDFRGKRPSNSRRCCALRFRVPWQVCHTF